MGILNEQKVFTSNIKYFLTFCLSGKEQQVFFLLSSSASLRFSDLDFLSSLTMLVSGRSSFFFWMFSYGENQERRQDNPHESTDVEHPPPSQDLVDLVPNQEGQTVAKIDSPVVDAQRTSTQLLQEMCIKHKLI
jgi:hypothetical protein